MIHNRVPVSVSIKRLNQRKEKMVSLVLEHVMLNVCMQSGIVKSD